MAPRVGSLHRFVMGTLLDASLLAAIATGWYLIPDDPAAHEGLAFVLFSLAGLGALTAGWGCWEGWRGLRVSWSLLRWSVACAAATIGIQLIAAVNQVSTGGLIDVAINALVNLAVMFLLVVPGAVGGTAVGRAIRGRQIHSGPRRWC